MPQLVWEDCRLSSSYYSIFRHDFVFLFTVILCMTSITVFISHNWAFFAQYRRLQWLEWKYYMAILSSGMEA